MRLSGTGIGIVAVAVASLLSACDPVPDPSTFTVTTIVDGLDHTPGDGACEVTPGAGDCSLRAAFAEAAAAGNAVVVAPNGIYSLTVPDPGDGHADLDVVGTLDLRPIGAVRNRIQVLSSGTAIDVGEAATFTTERVSFSSTTTGPVVRTRGSAFLSRTSVEGGNPAIEVASEGTLVLGTSAVAGSRTSTGVGLSNAGTAAVLFSTILGSQEAAVHTAPGARTDVGASKVSVAVYLRSAWFEIWALHNPGVVIDACSGAGLDSLGYNRVLDSSCSLGEPTDGFVPGATSVDQVPFGVLGCGTTFAGDFGGILGNPRPRPADGDGDGVAACDIGHDEGAVGVALSTDLLPGGTVGACYRSTLVAPVSNATGWTVTGLPPGLVLDGSTVRGVPTAAGDHDVTIVLRTSTGGGRVTVTVTIEPPTGPPATNCP